MKKAMAKPHRVYASIKERGGSIKDVNASLKNMMRKELLDTNSNNQAV